MHAPDSFHTTPQYVILECFNRGSAETVKSLFILRKNKRIFDGHARGPSPRNFFSRYARKKRFLGDTRLFLYIKNERVLTIFFKNNSTSQSKSLSNEHFC